MGAVSHIEVADRYQIRLAVRKISKTSAFRRRNASLQDLTPEALEAFALSGYRVAVDRQAFLGGLAKKLKELMVWFKKAPNLWVEFKKLIQIEGLSELPHAMEQLLSKGKKAFRDTLVEAFHHFPLSLYVLEKGKLKGIGDWIEHFIQSHPKIKSFMDIVAHKADSFDKLLRKYLPVVGTLLVVAIFCFIWWNTQEIDWDFKDLLSAFSGHVTLGDMISSLPEATVGFLMHRVGLGSFTMLPVMFMARLSWFLIHKHIVFRGEEFQVNEASLHTAFHIPHEEALIH